MNYLVTVTSQGQITIPAQIRRRLNLDKKRNALISLEGEKAIIEPAADIMELEGALHDKAIKGKSLQEIIKLEQQAVEEAVIERYKQKNERSKANLQ